MLAGVSHIHPSTHSVQCLPDKSRDRVGGRGDTARTETPEHASRDRLYERALLLEELRADARQWQAADNNILCHGIVIGVLGAVGRRSVNRVCGRDRDDGAAAGGEEGKAGDARRAEDGGIESFTNDRHVGQRGLVVVVDGGLD